MVPRTAEHLGAAACWPHRSPQPLPRDQRALHTAYAPKGGDRQGNLRPHIGAPRPVSEAKAQRFTCGSPCVALLTGQDPEGSGVSQRQSRSDPATSSGVCRYELRGTQANLPGATGLHGQPRLRPLGSPLLAGDAGTCYKLE